MDTIKIGTQKLLTYHIFFYFHKIQVYFLIENAAGILLYSNTTQIKIYFHNKHQLASNF